MMTRVARTAVIASRKMRGEVSGGNRSFVNFTAQPHDRPRVVVTMSCGNDARSNRIDFGPTVGRESRCRFLPFEPPIEIGGDSNGQIGIADTRRAARFARRPACAPALRRRRAIEMARLRGPAEQVNTRHLAVAVAAERLAEAAICTAMSLQPAPDQLQVRPCAANGCQHALQTSACDRARRARMPAIWRR